MSARVHLSKSLGKILVRQKSVADVAPTGVKIPSRLLTTRSQDSTALRLWAAAYDEIKVAFPELVSQYEKIVSRYISQEDASAEAKGSNEYANMNAHHAGEKSFPALMDKVLGAWFSQQAQEPSAGSDWKKIVRLVQDTWEQTPRVSIPWVAICLSLQVRQVLDAS